jgi:quinol monooxygenase YgiN
MAVCLIFDAPGMTKAQYEQVRDEVTQGDRPPQGALNHVAGATDNGWCVVETWESQEALDRFFQEKLQKALQKAGITHQPRIFEVTNTMQP